MIHLKFRRVIERCFFSSFSLIYFFKFSACTCDAWTLLIQMDDKQFVSKSTYYMNVFIICLKEQTIGYFLSMSCLMTIIQFGSYFFLTNGYVSYLQIKKRFFFNFGIIFCKSFLVHRQFWKNKYLIFHKMKKNPWYKPDIKSYLFPEPIWLDIAQNIFLVEKSKQNYNVDQANVSISHNSACALSTLTSVTFKGLSNLIYTFSCLFELSQINT